MMQKRTEIAPEPTSVRVAQWRALHLLCDPPPHVFHDDLGAKLVDETHWQQRPDMNPQISRQMRASIVGRARYIEDLVEQKLQEGLSQYVILGAGLDTFAQRRPDLAARLQIFEVDQIGPQRWKQQRLRELGLPLPSSLHFVPVNFEAGETWWQKLDASGFDRQKPAVVVSTGVSMYLSREANFATMAQVAKLSPGSVLAMTFLLALDLLPPDERAIMEIVMSRTSEAGSPFVSLFRPDDLLSLAKSAGFPHPKYVSAADLFQLYFAQRQDGLHAGTAEAFLVARSD